MAATMGRRRRAARARIFGSGHPEDEPPERGDVDIDKPFCSGGEIQNDYSVIVSL